MPTMMIDFGNARIPEHTKSTLENYLLYGLPPGGFMTAVLTNDLYGAISRADSQNMSRLEDIVRWLQHNAPIDSYGNYENITNWVNDAHGDREKFAAGVEKDYVWRSLRQAGQ